MCFYHYEKKIIKLPIGRRLTIGRNFFEWSNLLQISINNKPFWLNCLFDDSKWYFIIFLSQQVNDHFMLLNDIGCFWNEFQVNFLNFLPGRVELGTKWVGTFVVDCGCFDLSVMHYGYLKLGIHISQKLRIWLVSYLYPCVPIGLFYVSII